MIQRSKHPSKIATKVGVILFCSILCFPLNLFCVIVINSITTSSQNDLSFWTISENFYGLNQRCTYLLILSKSTLIFSQQENWPTNLWVLPVMSLNIILENKTLLWLPSVQRIFALFQFYPSSTCFWELLLHPGLYTQKGNKFTKIGSNSRIYIKLNLLMVKSGNLISRVPARL